LALIAVDLTPVRSGGENGGAKVLAVELLKGLPAIAVNDRFLLLTASWNHEELASLEGARMQRLCVIASKPAENAGRNFFQSYIPERLVHFAGRTLQVLKRKIKNSGVLKRSAVLSAKGVDLLFCPFSAPTFYEPGIPVVSVVHDLQHVDYPHFFDSAEIRLRNEFFEDIRNKASHIICVSEYVRQSVVDHLDVDPGKISCIYNSIHKRLATESPSASATLEGLGLVKNRYAFYPANFWPHKNHRMLLLAFKIFLSRNPDQNLSLVFTGALEEAEKELRLDAEAMGISDRVHFLGFLPSKTFEAVWHGARFLLYPSLYEGFGMPILEAMAIGKPVLCSHAASLPEVAGDAALFFDPRKPMDIVEKMERLMADPALEKRMVASGCRRAEAFSPKKMVDQYDRLLHSAMRSPMPARDEMTGVYEDGWTGGEVTVMCAAKTPSRVLEARFEAPAHIPKQRVKIDLYQGGRKIQKFKVSRGETLTIRQPVMNGHERLVLAIHPTFCPEARRMGPDKRELGLLCRSCSLVGSGTRNNLMERR